MKTKQNSYHVRAATEEDMKDIRALVRSTHSFHTGSSGLTTQDPSAVVSDEDTLREKLNNLSQSRQHRGLINRPVFLRLDWRKFVVAVSGEGTVIGCGSVVRRKKDILELSSISADPAWHRQGVASAIVERLISDHPRPLWGTCLDHLKPFYERFGAEEVLDLERMPPFYRRRKRFFDLVLRISGRKRYLAVMVLK